MHDQFFGKWPLYLDQDGSQQDPAAARCPEINFWSQIWIFHPKKNYNLTCMITFLVSDLYIYLDQDGSQQDPVAARCPEFFFIPNLEFPQKKYNLTCKINFLVSDLYTWIKMAPSRIQHLPGVQN